MSAEEYKAKGNAAFSAEKNDEAVNWFTSAINHDPSNHVLYSNRSAAHCANKNFGKALQDANKTVEIKPDWAKGWSRKGAALIGLEKYEEAADAYQKGLDVEPTNEACKEGLQQARSHTMGSGANMFGKVFGPGCVDKIRSNPKLAPFLMQPDYMQIITMLQTNPGLIQGFMQDKRIMATFLELSGLGDKVKFASGDDDEDEPAKPPPKPAPKPQAKPAKEVSSEEKKKKDEAEKVKELGNQCYKKKQFDEALQHYDKAIEIDPSNLLYLLNKASVYLEQGELEKATAQCDEAGDRARQEKNFEALAKALSRKGSVLQRKGDYTEAIRCFKESLMENRQADTLDKLNKCEKEKKQKEVDAYLDPEKAKEAKERGNALFRDNNYPESIKEYSEAIKRDPKDPTFYSNRAAAYMKMREYGIALADIDQAIKINPKFVKAYVRKGQCYHFTKEYHKAVDAYEQALEVEPENEEAKNGIDSVMQAVHSAGDDPERARRGQSDPEIQRILQDPVMSQVLRECSENPKALQKHLQNPGIAQKIRRLMLAGVLRMG